jgi:hypothetical protein
MKRLYISPWLGVAIVFVVALGATHLILHTIASMNASYLSYLSLAGSSN